MLGWWSPENASTHADHVMHVVFWASSLALVALQVWLALADREDSAVGDVQLRMVWAIVPALFLVGLGLFGSTR
jgi:hypothetical protein